MEKRVFLSFAYAEQAHLNDLLAFFTPNGGPVQAQPVLLDRDVSSGGDAAIRNAILEKMQGCVGVLALVGEVAHSKPWAETELRLARELGIPFVGIRHPSATRGGPPAPFQSLAFLDWDRERVAAHVAEWKPRARIRLEWVEATDEHGQDARVCFRRARVPGGWLVTALDIGEGFGVTFVPDAEHRW